MLLEYFCEWIQQIAYYMILVTLVMQVTAGESYRKYIRLFTGIILILFILSPMLRLLGLEGGEYVLAAEEEYEEAAKRIEEKIQRLEEEASIYSEAESFSETLENAGTAADEAGEDHETWRGEGAGNTEDAENRKEAGKIEVGEIRIGR